MRLTGEAADVRHDLGCNRGTDVQRVPMEKIDIRRQEQAKVSRASNAHEVCSLKESLGKARWGGKNGEGAKQLTEGTRSGAGLWTVGPLSPLSSPDVSSDPAPGF